MWLLFLNRLKTSWGPTLSIWFIYWPLLGLPRSDVGLAGANILKLAEWITAWLPCIQTLYLSQCFCSCFYLNFTISWEEAGKFLWSPFNKGELKPTAMWYWGLGSCAPGQDLPITGYVTRWVWHFIPSAYLPICKMRGRLRCTAKFVPIPLSQDTLLGSSRVEIKPTSSVFSFLWTCCLLLQGGAPSWVTTDRPPCQHPELCKKIYASFLSICNGFPTGAILWGEKKALPMHKGNLN